MDALMVGAILKNKQDLLNSLSPEMALERECIQRDITLLKERYAETFENCRQLLSSEVTESSALFCLYGIDAGLSMETAKIWGTQILE